MTWWVKGPALLVLVFMLGCTRLAGWRFALAETACLLTALPGYVIVPIAAAIPVMVVTRESQFYPGRQITAWRFRALWPWGNEEDGLEGSANGFWPKPVGYLARWWQIVKWSAQRNSSDNMKYATARASINTGEFFLWEGEFRGNPVYLMAGWRQLAGLQIYGVTLSAGAGHP